MMKKRIYIFLPLLLALAVAGGYLLGIINKNVTDSADVHRMSLYSQDKLSVILSLIERDYVDSVDKTEIIEEIIPSILEDLDPHTNYISAEDMKSISEEMRGSFSGIGVQFVMQRDTVLIVDVISGGPSYELGLNSSAIVGMLRGKGGTKVNVGIKRGDIDELIPFEIKRGKIPLYSVDVTYMINDNTGYIKVSKFAEKTYREFVDGINVLVQDGAQNLIVDLRGNTGGYLGQVIDMVDEFLAEGEMIVYTQGKNRRRSEVKSTRSDSYDNMNLVVLMDEYSASASEIFAGAIQDNDRGIIVGRRSFGKGLVQEQIPFLDGSVLRLTVSRYYTPSGRCIQKTYENGIDEYRKDIGDRIVHGEFYEVDSISMSDTLVYPFKLCLFSSA